MCPTRILQYANYLMPAAVLVMLAGAYIGFVDHTAWTLQAQVLAHIGIMLGAGLLKLSYVMHLNASMHLGINDYAPAPGANSGTGRQSNLPACCLPTAAMV